MMAERISIDTYVPISGDGHVKLSIDIPDVRCMTAADQRFTLGLLGALSALTGWNACQFPDLEKLDGGR